ncbi:leucyl aminopeptidase family protein [Cohnella nanjingensis]|uniref:Probable cytosol aminopeptidase n=1 Tax=Cohnella nanjingensis TaxID=1387779 RepID=A0A7X0VFV3_9BACL|nr:leucyl aminopeptidase family protein [Cohnella nanjingensis]MBB6672442.1 leucyl aminopeptidase family protein [Cohnella nanjingensis]
MRFELGDDASAGTVVLPAFADRLANAAELQALRGFGAAKLPPQTGARHAVTWFYGADGRPDVLIAGLGSAAEYKPARLREAAGNAGRALCAAQRTDAAVSFALMRAPGAPFGAEPETLAAWVEGTLLGTYTFDKYKSNAQPRPELNLTLAAEDGPASREAMRLARIRAESTIWARDLTNEPPNGLRPRTLAERTIARFAGTAAEVTVHEDEALERLGFAGLAAVGRGSAHPPVFIEVRYGEDESQPLVALIGKGITFDTGGISLKRDNDISDMRMDMAGAAAVLGAVDALVRSGAPVRVAALVPAAENCPSDRALLPGEVIRYANGVTVQVGNTDSEGRLVLADALIHAHRLGAAEAIDLATLTYSVVGALGSKVAGALGDDGLIRALGQAGEPYDERIWQLPLVDEYESYLDSDYADTSNISSKGEAGVITSSLFLRKFVHPSLKWAHLDINGPKEASSARGEQAVGATGFGVRMLAAYVEQAAEG